VDGRAYRGMSAAQRMADRRERLLGAAYTLFATRGFPNTTIERLCATARISNRAFYECFSGREDLLRAVYNRCVDETLQWVTNSISAAPASLQARIEAGIAAYIDFVTHDPRRARIMHVEVRRSGSLLDTARQRSVAAFARLIEEVLAEHPQVHPTNQRLLVLGMIGALQELLIEWVLAETPPATDELVGTAVHIFRRSFAA
jgi:AcrR family transcriptional regulator